MLSCFPEARSSSMILRRKLARSTPVFSAGSGGAALVERYDAVNSVFFSEIYQTLEGSFSSVSKPIFATEYSFFSILRDLQDLHTFAPLESQVENYLEKNLPENPKENERTRPHGKVEKEETKRDAWNSA